MFVWAIPGILTLVAVLALLPIGFGVSFHFADGKGELRVIVAFAHRLHWRVIVPTRLMRLGKQRMLVTARTGFRPEGELRLSERIGLRKLLEERKVPESQLHMILTGVDLIQTLFMGKSASDGRGRSLGSPVLHLIFAPIMFFARSLCKVDFGWQTRLGTGDAVSTALGTGLLWTVKSGCGALLAKRFVVLHTPQVNVTPDFDNITFATDIRCIFHLSIGQIIWRAVRDAAQRWQGKGAGAFGG